MIINVYHPNHRCSHRCSHGFNMTPSLQFARPVHWIQFDSSGVRTEMQFQRITAPSSSLCLPPFPLPLVFSVSHDFYPWMFLIILIWYDLFVDDRTLPLWIIPQWFCHRPCSQRMLLVVGLVGPESSTWAAVSRCEAGNPQIFRSWWSHWPRGLGLGTKPTSVGPPGTFWLWPGQKFDPKMHQRNHQVIASRICCCSGDSILPAEVCQSLDWRFHVSHPQVKNKFYILSILYNYDIKQSVKDHLPNFGC
jgi:hypothetical protein